MLNGGIFGVALVYYMTLPVTGAWLFGFRAALAIAGFCAGSSLYFPGTPLGTWTMIMAATFLMTVPVAVVLQLLKDRLSQYQSAQVALRREQGYLEELVHRRTLELLKARDQAEAANRAKRVFLDNMSHELLTPLNAILGFSTLVRGGPGLSARQRKDLEIISRSGEHLLDLIEEVLDLSNNEETPGQPRVKIQLRKASPFAFSGDGRGANSRSAIRAFGGVMRRTGGCPDLAGRGSGYGAHTPRRGKLPGSGRIMAKSLGQPGLHHHAARH